MKSTAQKSKKNTSKNVTPTKEAVDVQKSSKKRLRKEVEPQDVENKDSLANAVDGLHLSQSALKRRKVQDQSQIDGKASVTKQLDGKMNKEPEEEKKGSENLNVENVQAASSDSGADCLASYESFVAELGDWQECLKDYLSKPGFRSVYDFVKSEYEKSSVPIYPPKHLIFNAFKNTQFKDLKVVLVGQDPYIKKDEAMGLCFSIPKHVKVPPSLKNIYKALENDPKVQFKTPAPIHGDLSAWAQQGVLMLNAILTVKEAISNSHQKKGWEQFTDAVIQAINQKADGVVFVLWGGKAQDKASSVNANKHCVLKFVHPSPLAGKGFPECKNFSQANDYLISKGKTAINWQV